MKHSSIILVVGCLLCIGALSSCEGQPEFQRATDIFYVKVIKYTDPSYKSYCAGNVFNRNLEIEGGVCWSAQLGKDSTGTYLPTYPFWQLDDDYLLLDWRHKTLSFLTDFSVLLMPWDTLIAKIERGDPDVQIRGDAGLNYSDHYICYPIDDEYKLQEHVVQYVYPIGLVEIEQYFGKTFKEGDWEYDVFFQASDAFGRGNGNIKYCENPEEADSLWAELTQQINILIKDDMLEQLSREYITRIEKEGLRHPAKDWKY